MRRLILEEPYSQAALWSRRCAILALPVAGFGLAFGRFGFTDLPNAVAVFVSALLLAVLALVLTGFAAAAIWNKGLRGLGKALTGAFLALALLAWPVFMVLRSLDQPQLTDISTDTDVPPSFSGDDKAVAQRGFMPSAMPANQRMMQAKAYPDIQPLVLDMDVQDAYATAQAVVKALGWQIMDTQAPSIGAADGRLEARARSLLMGIPYALSIRIKALPEGTRLDIRSASHLGAHDFGANAELIRKFTTAFKNEVDGR
jgi:uncharacterized protein (DUF1499 family)